MSSSNWGENLSKFLYVYGQLMPDWSGIINRKKKIIVVVKFKMILWIYSDFSYDNKSIF